MENGNTKSIERLENLLYSISPEDLEKIATDPNTPAQILSTIYFERLWPVDEVAIKYNKTPRSIQSVYKIAEAKQNAGLVYSIHKFFRNPNMPKEVLADCFEEAVTDGNLNMMIMLLENPNFPENYLEDFATGNFERYEDEFKKANKFIPNSLYMDDFKVYMSYAPDFKTLLTYAAVNNPNLSPDILLKLANESKDTTLLNLVAKNPNLSRDGFDILFGKEKIEKPKNSWERRRELPIIEGLAENPSIPEDIARAIYNADREFGYRLLNSKNVPSDVLKEIYENMGYGDIGTQHLLAMQKNLPENILLELYNDEGFNINIYCHESFLKNPNLPPYILAEMLNQEMPTNENYLWYEIDGKCKMIEEILAHQNFPYSEGFPKDVTPELLSKTPALKHIILGKLKNPKVPTSEKERILIQHGIIGQEASIIQNTENAGISFETEALLAYFKGIPPIKESSKTKSDIIDMQVDEQPLLTNAQILELQQKVASLESENASLKKELEEMKKMFPQMFGGKTKRPLNLDDSDDGSRDD